MNTSCKSIRSVDFKLAWKRSQSSLQTRFARMRSGENDWEMAACDIHGQDGSTIQTFPHSYQRFMQIDDTKNPPAYLELRFWVSLMHNHCKLSMVCDERILWDIFRKKRVYSSLMAKLYTKQLINPIPVNRWLTKNLRLAHTVQIVLSSTAVYQAWHDR